MLEADGLLIRVGEDETVLIRLSARRWPSYYCHALSPASTEVREVMAYAAAVAHDGYAMRFSVTFT